MNLRALAKTAGWLALLGLTVGTILDGFHTWSGTTTYADPTFLKGIWWQPPLFAAAAVVIGVGRVATESALRKGSRLLTWNETLAALALFVASYAISAWLPFNDQATGAVLLALFFAGWFAWDRTALGIAAAVIVGIGGWLVEHTLASAGHFAYADPTLGATALWLPALYAVASLSLGALAKRVYATSEPSPEPVPVSERANAGS